MEGPTLWDGHLHLGATLYVLRHQRQVIKWGAIQVHVIVSPSRDCRRTSSWTLFLTSSSTLLAISVGKLVDREPAPDIPIQGTGRAGYVG